MSNPWISMEGQHTGVLSTISALKLAYPIVCQVRCTGQNRGSIWNRDARDWGKTSNLYSQSQQQQPINLLDFPHTVKYPPRYSGPSSILDIPLIRKVPSLGVSMVISFLPFPRFSLLGDKPPFQHQSCPVTEHTSSQFLPHIGRPSYMRRTIQTL